MMNEIYDKTKDLLHQIDNKSSVIRALYGAPAQKSLGEYWFESKIDTISEEEKHPSCFIYGYVSPLENKTVEVLKTRVHKENDPDYWEPSRPIAQYGMEKIESPVEKAHLKSMQIKAPPKDVIIVMSFEVERIKDAQKVIDYAESFCPSMIESTFNYEKTSKNG